MRSLLNILWLGLKELRSLWQRHGAGAVRRLRVHVRRSTSQATATSSEVNNALDRRSSTRTARRCRRSSSTRSIRRASSRRRSIGPAEVDRGDGHRALHVRRRHPAALRARPPRRAGSPTVQVNIDATAMSRPASAPATSRTSSTTEVALRPARGAPTPPRPIPLVVRGKFNPNLNGIWFKSVVAIINQITLLTVVLTGRGGDPRARARHARAPAGDAADAAFEIAMAKVWANGLVILVAAGAVALARRAGRAEGAVRRLGAAVPVRRRAPPVLRDRARHLPGHDRPLDGAVRAADHPGDRCRCSCSPAAMTPLESMPEARPDHHAGGADHPLRASSRRPSSTAAPASTSSGRDFLAITALGAVFFLVALARFRGAVARAES